MDLVGKAFRNEYTMIYVESIEKFSEKYTSYNIITLSKEKFGYNLGHHTMRNTAITYTFPTETDKNVVLKAKVMFELNYIACCSLAKNVKVVKSSRHLIRIGSGVLLWGSYDVNIYKYYIRVYPMTQRISEYYGLGEHITKKDYNKIFHKVKQLKKDFDKLWTDVV